MTAGKTTIRGLRRLGEVVFKRDSIFYRSGASLYRRLRPVLARLDREERIASNNAMQVADIARASMVCEPGESAKRIVFLTVRGWRPHLATETMIAARLRQMGHKVSFLLCAESLSFCMFGSVTNTDQYDQDCFACCESKAILPGPYFESDQLSCPEESKRKVEASVEQLGIDQCRQFEWEGFPYGELLYTSVAWFLRRSRLTESDAPIYRKALVSAHVTRVGLERTIAERQPDTVVMLNGDFNVERVACFVLKRLGVRYVTHDYTFHERLGVAANSALWDDLTFSDESRVRPPAVTQQERSDGEKLLKQWRRTGGYQGELYWTSEDLQREANLLRGEVGLDARPLAVAYTNLTFESSVLGKDRAFKDQFDWLTALVGWFSAHEAFQLAIRIHPAEVRNDHWRPNESLFAFMTDKLAPLPENVHIVSPSAKVSSYALGSLARLVLVYTSTLGLEMAERGKQVVTAAHAHYAGRGFTLDPATPKEYFEILERNIQQDSVLSDEGRTALVNYVSWFMFRRLTPVEPFSVGEDWPGVKVNTLADLSSSELKGFQQVCAFIADNTSWW